MCLIPMRYMDDIAVHNLRKYLKAEGAPDFLGASKTSLERSAPLLGSSSCWPDECSLVLSIRRKGLCLQLLYHLCLLSHLGAQLLHLHETAALGTQSPSRLYDDRLA